MVGAARGYVCGDLVFAKAAGSCSDSCFERIGCRSVGGWSRLIARTALSIAPSISAMFCAASPSPRREAVESGAATGQSTSEFESAVRVLSDVPLLLGSRCGMTARGRPRSLGRPRQGVLACMTMRSFRRHFVSIIGGWLLCQSSALILVPVSMCAGDRTSAVEQTCACAHAADGQECPMSHTRTTKTTRGQSPSSCSCRGTSDAPAAMIVALTGPVAVLTSETTLPAPASTARLSSAPTTVLPNASTILDPPPPRV